MIPIYPTFRTVALRIAVLLKRSGKQRARISDKTLRILSQRGTLREALVSGVRAHLEDLGIVAIRLDRGGFALIHASALDGAPSALVKHLMPEYRKLDDEQLWNELGLPDDEQDE